LQTIFLLANGMDIDLARTFLEVVASRSFVAAADRLNLTQTAVSARIRVLEEQLDRRLFVRNRAGARLTPAGQRFVQHATALVQLWERARQQVALPSGRSDLVSLGCEFSLWNPLLTDLLSWMRRTFPEIAVRAEVDAPARLLERVQAAALDLAIVYNPPSRADLVNELIAQEKLVLVTTSPDGRAHPGDYVLVDWGPVFRASHDAAFPHLGNPAVTISLGHAARSYLLDVGGAAYLRSGALADPLTAGALRKVAGAPEFSHSMYAVYSARSATEALDHVRAGLKDCVARQSAQAPAS
jgi:DNA-binding transcriptional LysR family regulator